MATAHQKNGIRHRSRIFYHAHVRKPALRFCTDVLQHIPISSEHFGPPKGMIASSRQWLESGSVSGGEFIPVHPTERLNFVPLRSVESEADFETFYREGLDSPIIQTDEAGNRYTEIPPTFVVKIPGGRSYGIDGAVITPTDYLLGDLSPEYVASRYVAEKHSVLAQMRLPEVRHFQGTVAVLASLGAQGYFAHWMMDMLPRIGLLESAGILLDQIDWFFVNSATLPYQQQSLEIVGIPKSKMIDCAAYPHIKADRLIVPSPVSSAFATSRETCTFLRRAFLTLPPLPDVGCPKRIYISRASAKHRRVINENEIMETLSKYGFTALKSEEMSFAEKSQVFAQADVIVMPTGSAMANLVYCKPGAKIIEVLNPRAVQAGTWAICSQLNADYYFMFAQGADQNDGVLAQDLVVDIDKLTQTLSHAGVG